MPAYYSDEILRYEIEQGLEAKDRLIQWMTNVTYANMKHLGKEINRQELLEAYRKIDFRD